jgi:hypothetical protein
MLNNVNSIKMSLKLKSVIFVVSMLCVSVAMLILASHENNVAGVFPGAMACLAFYAAAKVALKRSNFNEEGEDT